VAQGLLDEVHLREIVVLVAQPQKGQRGFQPINVSQKSDEHKTEFSTGKGEAGGY